MKRTYEIKKWSTCTMLKVWVEGRQFPIVHSGTDAYIRKIHSEYLKGNR